MGRTKLWPEISPKKTVEGSLGGLLGATIVAFLAQFYFAIFSSYLIVIVYAVILSFVAQMGDLMESALKRHFGVKDSGRLLPGHGGLLDRFDSLLIAFPVFYLLINLSP